MKSNSAEPQSGQFSHFFGSGIEVSFEYVTNPQLRHSINSVRLGILLSERIADAFSNIPNEGGKSGLKAVFKIKTQR